MNVKSIYPLMFLLLLTACYGSRRQQMLTVLDEADSLNRNYIPFATDSQLLAATRFFDAHGTSLEQLRAHYLLGCAYRDLGQAPEALQAWHDAIDRADTTSRDSAVLERLMAVYGQMAELYDGQRLAADEILAMKEYGKYALLAKDTFRYIRNIELMGKPYEKLGDTAKVVDMLHRASSLYEKAGLHNWSVRTFPTLIYINIERGCLDDASKMIQQFEKESGLFDDDGNIERGRENYYYIKGLYHYQRGNIALAETYMRRLLLYRGEKVNALRGLLKIYQRKGEKDSISRFSFLLEHAIDSVNLCSTVETVHQMSSLYNYHVFQSKADRLSRKNLEMRLVIVVIVMASVMLLLIFVSAIIFLWKKRVSSQKRYIENCRLLEKLYAEVEVLKKHESEYKDIISEKLTQINDLNNEMSHYRKKGAYRFSSNGSVFKDSNIYHHFHKMADTGRRPTDEEWTSLMGLFESQLPNFYYFLMSNRHNLNDTELKTCMLTRIHITPAAIGSMLGVTKAYISKIRRNMLKNLFCIEGETKQFDSLIDEIG